MTDPRQHDGFVFGAVAYLNAAPLAEFLAEGRPDVRVAYGRPAELLEPLLAGRYDAALVPVVDYFAHDELARIDGPGICADGDVQSVLLKCYRPIEQIRTVAPDPASRTSNALARIILTRHFGRPVRMADPPPGEPPDAAVVIGDRAMSDPPAAYGDLDLAGQWKAMTGLPFVFAVWAYRRDHPDAEALSRIARDARDAGLRALPRLAAEYAPKLGLSESRCLDYLSSALSYHVGPREIEAMRLFRQACRGAPEGALP